MIAALMLALASPAQLTCTHELTGERRPAQIIRLGGRQRIALQARLIGRVPRARRASIILPPRQIEWSCIPADGRRYPVDPD